MQYVICEYEKIKEVFPEFEAVQQNLARRLVAKATADWTPLTFGGMNPRSGQFGATTILPATMRGINNTTLATWRQYWTAAQVVVSLAGTSQVIMSGVNSGSMREDYMIGLSGVCFLDKAIRVTEIKFQIGDHKIPRINLEEALVYNKPCVVFEEGFILGEEEGFDMYGYLQSEGQSRIKLLGLQLNRIPNKTQVTNCGAAL